MNEFRIEHFTKLTLDKWRSKKDKNSVNTKSTIGQ